MSSKDVPGLNPARVEALAESLNLYGEQPVELALQAAREMLEREQRVLEGSAKFEGNCSTAKFSLSRLREIVFGVVDRDAWEDQGFDHKQMGIVDGLGFHEQVYRHQVGEGPNGYCELSLSSFDVMPDINFVDVNLIQAARYEVDQEYDSWHPTVSMRAGFDTSENSLTQKPSFLIWRYDSNGETDGGRRMEIKFDGEGVPVTASFGGGEGDPRGEFAIYGGDGLDGEALLVEALSQEGFTVGNGFRVDIIETIRQAAESVRGDDYVVPPLVLREDNT